MNDTVLSHPLIMLSAEPPDIMLRSNDVFLEAKDDRAEITLTIPAKSCPEVAGKTLLTEKDSLGEHR